MLNRYVLVHVGFETPTPEIMAAWGKWFESIADRAPDNVGPFMSGREITSSGTKELSLGPDAVTGYSVIDAESLDEAEAVAKECPSITAIRVYEIAKMQGH